MRPYIIAEAGVNHDGNILTAFKLVETAASSGADCVKFQAYTSNELVIKTADKAEYHKQGVDESQYDMLLKYELKRDDFKEINSYCQQSNIDFLVTPFSPSWVKALYDMGVKRLKISSGSIRSRCLLKEIGMTGLPVILSTGMSTLEEVEGAVSILKNNGCGSLSLLHCVSLYPTPLEYVSLFVMHTLREKFNVPVGFSDHTSGIIAGQFAVAAGAEILEKHFTVDKHGDGPDHKMSLTPYELKEYIVGARRTSEICGSGIKEMSPEELKMREVSQDSLVAKRFIRRGEKISEDMLVEKRPSTGISPMDVNSVIGRTVVKDIETDEILTYCHLED